MLLLPLAHIMNLINFSFHRQQKCWRFPFYIAPTYSPIRSFTDVVTFLNKTLDKYE